MTHDSPPELALTIDPIVVALAVALSARTPIAAIVSDRTAGSGSAGSMAAATNVSSGRSRPGSARTPRSKNRKG